MRALHQHELFSSACDRRLELTMRRIVLAGAALVLAVPAARGSSAWLGAWPLWLLGMPLASWWALHRFRLPRWPQSTTIARRRRVGGVQARRHGAAVGRDRALVRAA